MGLLDVFKKSDINTEAEMFRKTPGVVMIDVRNAEEHAKGHIPGSINIAEKDISKVENIIYDKSTQILVYCLSGAKSWSAEKKLKEMGYKNARSIGGIKDYTGPVEK